MGDVIEKALTALLEAGWVEDAESFFARLCLEEALVNAITHGNQQDETRRVTLAVYDDGELCRMEVTDEGSGCFRPELVPEPGGSKLHGRGLCLIKHFMDSVEYSQTERKLTMSFRKQAFSKGGCNT